MIRFLFVAFLLFSFLSCNRKNRVEDEISSFYSRHINLSFDKMKCLKDGMDTLVLERTENIDLKYVVYVDSTRCSSCMWKDLYRWNTFLYDIRTYKGKIKVYFIFCPLSFKVEELYLSMRKHKNLNSYVYVDTANVFLQSNTDFPENPLLHTFLLDKNNTVLLVGNPIDNLLIINIFWRTVEERLGKPRDDKSE